MATTLPPNPADCEGHQDEDWVLLFGAGIGESLYCNGACVPADERTPKED